MNSTLTGRLRSIAAAGLVAISPVVIGAATHEATASPAVTLNFHCTFPLIGPQPLAVQISTSLPASIPVGQPTGQIDVAALAKIGADTTTGLAMVGAKKLEGVADAKTRIEIPGGTGLDLSVPTKMESTPVPDSGPFELKAAASIAPINFAQAGTARVVMKSMVFTVSPKIADGRLTGLDTFNVDCSLDAGQDGVIATIDVTGGGPTTGPTPTEPPQTPLSYTLTGSSVLKATQAQVPLSGSAKATITGTAVSADLALKPTQTSFKLFGFLPVSSQVVLTPQGKTVGQIGAGGVTTQTKVDVALPSITAFGFPFGGGPDCRTTTPAEVPLSATVFDPMKGGTLTGTYTLPPFADCGFATSAVNMVASGPGNTISVALVKS